MTPIIDESWAPVLSLLGLVIASLLTYIGVRSSNAAGLKNKQLETDKELIGEWKILKQEIQKDSEQMEIRLRASLEQEREARVSFETVMQQKLDAILICFAAYVEWARTGAKGPAPHIPDWVYYLIAEKLSEEAKHTPSSGT